MYPIFIMIRLHLHSGFFYKSGIELVKFQISISWEMLIFKNYFSFQNELKIVYFKISHTHKCLKNSDLG